MPRPSTVAGLLAALALLAPAATASADKPRPVGPAVDVAVIGDIPYGPEKIATFPRDIDQINADPTVSQVIHLGDIKNGSSRCDTSYFEMIRAQFDRFQDPLVYTPGDNEWTDCHRANNGGYQPAGPRVDGAPVLTPGPSRLDEVRRIFFPTPGRTLGQRPLAVDTQRSLVENVAYTTAGVRFATLDVPGSNNDAAPWFGAAETDALKRIQADEVATRTAADLAWMKQAFQEARRTHAPAIVLNIQADMWDPAITGDPAGYSAFTPIVQELAKLTRAFGKPVLLLNGDSHVYETDRPLSDPTATNNTIYGVRQAVPNLQRITVDGSDNAEDYLKLHVDPRSAAVFSYERVPYASAQATP